MNGFHTQLNRLHDESERESEEAFQAGLREGMGIAFLAIYGAVEGKLYARAVRSLVTKLRKCFAQVPGTGAEE